MKFFIQITIILFFCTGNPVFAIGIGVVDLNKALLAWWSIGSTFTNATVTHPLSGPVATIRLSKKTKKN